jgi:hypothetical protein
MGIQENGQKLRTRRFVAPRVRAALQLAEERASDDAQLRQSRVHKLGNAAVEVQRPCEAEAAPEREGDRRIGESFGLRGAHQAYHLSFSVSAVHSLVVLYLLFCLPRTR